MLFSKKLAELIAEESPQTRELTDLEISSLNYEAEIYRMKGTRYNPEKKRYENDYGDLDKTLWEGALSLPLKISWEVTSINGDQLTLSARLSANHKENSDNSRIFWRLRKAFETLYPQQNACLSKAIAKIDSQPWREAQEEFYCLESEIQELVLPHLGDLLALPGITLIV